MLSKVPYMVGGQLGFQQILVTINGDRIAVADLECEILIEHMCNVPRHG